MGGVSLFQTEMAMEDITKFFGYLEIFLSLDVYHFIDLDNTEKMRKSVLNMRFSCEHLDGCLS